MYNAILQALPLPRLVKVILVMIILAGIVALCFLKIFPYIIDYIPFPFGNSGYPSTPDNLQIIEGEINSE